MEPAIQANEHRFIAVASAFILVHLRLIFYIVIWEIIILFSAYNFIAITPNYPLNSSYASSIKRNIMK